MTSERIQDVLILRRQASHSYLGKILAPAAQDAIGLLGAQRFRRLHTKPAPRRARRCE